MNERVNRRIAAGRAMGWILGLSYVVAALTMSGCGGGVAEGMAPFQTQGARVGGGVGSGLGSAGDARFTILVAQYDGPGSLAQAQEVQQRARQVLGSDDVWLGRDGTAVAVHYGHFDKNTPRSPAQREWERVKAVYDRLGVGPYQFTYVKELPTPDPPAPPAWSLLNQDCAYSLEVAAFFNVPDKEFYDRKASAVQAVKNLRDQGEQAFFVHGRNQSRVYVGCYGPNAVGRDAQGNTQLSPLVEAVRKKYPYHENGQVIYVVSHLPGFEGKRIRQQAILMRVELRRDVPF